MNSEPPTPPTSIGRYPDKLAAQWEELRYQLRHADEDQIRASESAKALINEVDPLDDLGRTPVMIGYWWGNLAAANELVKMGANYGAKDAAGNTVSWYARNFGRGANALELSRHVNAEHLRISMNSEIRRISSDE